MESPDQMRSLRAKRQAADLDERAERYRRRAANDITDGIDAVLEGGPAGMPTELRAQRTYRTAGKIKVSYYGGWEHFERTTAPDTDDQPVVFRWIGRTRIAE